MITDLQVIKDFRYILKHFNRLPSYKSPSSMRNHIIQRVRYTSIFCDFSLILSIQYQIDRFESDKIKKQQLRITANSFATMVNGVKELKHLRGLDSGEKLDPRDKIRATAARVGLGVPKVCYYSDSLNCLLI